MIGVELNKSFALENISIDEISEYTVLFLQELNMEQKNQLRIRLLVEEILLDWQTRFGTSSDCHVFMGKRLGRPILQMKIKGASFNPLEQSADEYGAYRGRLMANMGLAPSFSYENGRNIITFKMKKQKQKPILQLVYAIALGMLVGGFGMLLPESIRFGILNRFLMPLYDTFFNLLGTIAGPMVFLSVAWGIYGIGDSATFGRIGKRMIVHFLYVFFGICIFATLFAIPFFDLHFSMHSDGASQLDTLFLMILGFVPTDLVSPFMQGNFMQIITLAAGMGSALLILGKQTEIVALAIEQINYVVQFLMEIISRLVPYFIFIVLVQMIWSDTLNMIFSAWKPMLVFGLCIVFLCIGMSGFAALRCGTNVKLLVKKCFPTFLLGMSTASSVATFGTCVSTCERKLGIKSHITSFGVPLGIVMFPPGTAIYFILICIYTAELYAVECSPVWFLLAIFTVGVLAVASPPIPGGTLTCYTIIFAQLGLPAEGLAIALALDVLFDFVATGMNMFCLQLELLIQAKKMGMLNEKILQKPV